MMRGLLLCLLCVTWMQLALSITPTADPTSRPTPIPTEIPTANPTTAPTASPSTPTFSPTNPTATPTTAIPTTAAPSAIPTISPTAIPTTATPSNAPTNSPTDPTADPTEFPTNEPTSSPTTECSTYGFSGGSVDGNCTECVQAGCYFCQPNVNNLEDTYCFEPNEFFNDGTCNDGNAYFGSSSSICRLEDAFNTSLNIVAVIVVICIFCPCLVCLALAAVFGVAATPFAAFIGYQRRRQAQRNIPVETSAAPVPVVTNIEMGDIAPGTKVYGDSVAAATPVTSGGYFVNGSSPNHYDPISTSTPVVVVQVHPQR